MKLIQPGDYEVMEYLAAFLEETIRVKGLNYDLQLDQDIRQVLKGQL